MPNSTATNYPTIFVTRYVGRNANPRQYLIAIHKADVRGGVKRLDQKIATVQTITATDFKAAYLYAAKWFGLENINAKEVGDET